MEDDMLNAINLLRIQAFRERFCFAKQRDAEMLAEAQAIMRDQTATLQALRAQMRLLQAESWPMDAHHTTTSTTEDAGH